MCDRFWWITAWCGIKFTGGNIKDYLNDQVEKSIFIIREALAKFKRPAVLWSTGKDSTTVLSLIKKATFEQSDIPVIHIDTEKKFKEIYEFRDTIAKRWKLNLIITKNEEALKNKVSPETTSKFECCNLLKTEALKQVIKKYKFDAIIVSIRRDEHYIRNLERVMSPRDKEFKWHLLREKTSDETKTGDAPFVSEQQPELWNLFQTDFKDANHVRVHPILHWTELDVWKYIKKESLPVNPLYFSRNGYRYRSLGCACCTSPVKSDAKNINEIVRELELTDIEERSGRSQDKETIIRRLRALGYM